MVQEETFNLEEAKKASGYFYLASPYSKHPEGINYAAWEVSDCAGWLIRQGLSIFCPISHSHTIATHAKLDPLSHKIWLPADMPLMIGACGLIVAMLPTWKESYGVGVEIQQFQQDGKPIYYLNWPMAKEPIDDSLAVNN